jgi:FixJ family two-component response regulator
MGETMSKPAYVHIVDDNVSRRAQIARTLYTHRIHAEIYESLDELTYQPPKEGALLICEEVGDSALEEALTSLREQSGYMPFAVFSERWTTSSGLVARTN